MDSLRSSVLSAPSECDLLVCRVLLGLFSPVIHGPDNVAEPFWGSCAVSLKSEEPLVRQLFINQRDCV